MKPPENDLSKTHARPEHPDIQRARRDLSARAQEFENALNALRVANTAVDLANADTLVARVTEFEQANDNVEVAKRKIHDAQAALYTELRKVRRV